MKDTSRVFGNNLRYYLKQKGMQPEKIASKLGYSPYDIQKVMDSRLFLDRQEQAQIAEVLEMPVDRLYEELDDELYESASCLECLGKFSTDERKKEILDLFDIYCDIQETLADEGLKGAYH